MSHPQPPYGPQDPHQPDPYQPPGDPWAPLPPVPQPPVSGPPQPPASDPWAAPQPHTAGEPWAAPQPTPAAEPWAAPQPPVSGGPQQPGHGGQWAAPPPPPVSGAPGQPWSGPPVSGSPYPPVAGSPYPPVAGSPYPPTTPGYPLGAAHPVAPAGNKKKTVLIVSVVAVVLTLLCCVGGIAAVLVGADKAADEAAKALPTPEVTRIAPGAPTTSAPTENDGETFNMKPGETLVLSDDTGTIEVTVTKFTTATKGCRSYSPLPDKGMYLTAHVTATVTKGKGSVNPIYFRWVGADGTTENGLGGILASCGDTLDSGSGMPAGSKRTGTVIFDVADKNGVLEYQHRFRTAGSWKP